MSSEEELNTLLIKSLVLLEWRLKRLEFTLGSDTGEESASSNNLPILARLDKLDKKWQKLVKQEKVAGVMNDLCMLCELSYLTCSQH